MQMQNVRDSVAVYPPPPLLKKYDLYNYYKVNFLDKLSKCCILVHFSAYYINVFNNKTVFWFIFLFSHSCKDFAKGGSTNDNSS